MKSILRISSLCLFVCLLFISFRPLQDDKYLIYTANPLKSDIRMFWQDGQGQPIGNFSRLEQIVRIQSKTILFAMNGGMYQTDQSPLGLYIENGKQLHPLNTRKGTGNFYMQPNGVFYLDKSKHAHIVTTDRFAAIDSAAYATQSGPMLLIGGRINPLFQEHSANVNIRNGVGLRPDGTLFFMLSRSPVTFYDMAAAFQRQHCTDALYLDGYISQAYFPGLKWLQPGGGFGVLIAVLQ